MNHPNPSSLVDCLRWQAETQPDKIAYTFLIDADRAEVHFTYQELDLRARKIAAYLQANKAQGERVLLLYPPGLEFIAAFFGCLYAQAIAIPAYPPKLNRPLDRLQSIVTDSQATLALTTTKIFSDLETRLEFIPELKALKWQDTESIAPELTLQWEMPAIQKDTLAFLQYTSGSTAAPKGVMISHRNILQNELMIQINTGHTQDSVIAHWLPSHHDFGLIGVILQTVFVGLKCIFLSPIDFLQNPFAWLRMIDRYRANTTGGPNFGYDLCVESISEEQKAQLDLSCWEIAVNGSEPIRADTIERFSHAFASCGFRKEAFQTSFGMAEATLAVACGDKGVGPIIKSFKASALAQGRAVELTAEDEPDCRKLVSSGRPLYQLQIEIVDPETRLRCLDGTIGELWLSGQNISSGYWNRPEENAYAFNATIADTGAGPFFRTGDLGFKLGEETFITGRQKDVIIIRGQNHYPQDIEWTAAQSHDAFAFDSSAAFSVDVDGTERLVIAQEIKRKYRQGNFDEFAAALRNAVAQSHELQVYAVVFLKPWSIPKTSSGKVQRRACKKGYLEGTLDTVYTHTLENITVAPAEPTADLRGLVLSTIHPAEQQAIVESYLKDEVAQILQISPAQINHQKSLIALGIDSLMAIQMESRLSQRLQINISALDFLSGLTFDQLCRQITLRLTEDAAATPLSIPSADRTLELPLSSEQERLWFLYQLPTKNPAYHLPLAVKLNGPLDVSLLEKSLNGIVSRHETLQTTFQTRQGKPFIQILPALSLSLTVKNVSQSEPLQAVMTDFVRRPFDIAHESLCRAMLLRLNENEHILLVVLHHLIGDVASFGVFLRELAALYAVAELPALPNQAVDFSVWQQMQMNEETNRANHNYWKTHLADAPAFVDLPADRPRPETQQLDGKNHLFSIEPALFASLKSFSRAENVTLFTTLLAAFELLLFRYSGQKDLVLGSPTLGRTAQTENLIAFLAHPLPLRATVSAEMSFRDLLAQTGREVLAAASHQDLPFAKIVQAVQPVRSAAHPPIFNIMFGLAKSPLHQLHWPGFSLSQMHAESGASDFDIFLTLFEDTEAAQGVLTYNTSLFDTKTIEAFSAAYIQFLETCLHNAGQSLWQFELLNEALAAKSASRQVVISATFTAEPLENVLRFWLDQFDLADDVHFAPYNQVFQQLLDGNSLIAKNHAGANVLLIRFEDWLRFENTPRGDPQKLGQFLNELIQSLQSAALRARVPTFVFICPNAPQTLADEHLAECFEQMQTKLVEALAETAGVYTVTPQDVQTLYPVSDYHYRYGDEIGHIPYTEAYFTALGSMIARKIQALQNTAYKVIVLDCDQTLWAGICGEDGAAGIHITAAHQALQTFMVAQSQQGMLLCLCSKNNEADVFAVFDQHPEMPLQRAHISAAKINWNAKSENIQALADELNLGLESFIFIDDNPLECAEVEAACPQVFVVPLPQDANEIPRFLNNIWVFDHLQVTEADEQRAEFYRQNTWRDQIQQESPSLEAFLASLQLTIEITPLQPQHITRAAQLTQRTNQFNSTGKRLSENEVQQIHTSGAVECLTVSVTDRFGDYGLVGILLFGEENHTLRVDSFLLSCRALGRRVEHAMLARLGEIAITRGLQSIQILYNPTERNQPVRDFLQSVATQHEAAFTITPADACAITADIFTRNGSNQA